MSEFTDGLNESDLRNVVKALASRMAALEQRFVTVDALDEITDDMGTQRAGRFEAWDDDVMRMVMSGADVYDEHGIHAHLVGFDDDMNPQFWIDAQLGAGTFAGGNATLDRDGFKMEGLNFAAQQTATNDGNTRIGWLEMMVPDGSAVPAWALTYSTSTESLADNGGAEDGDLTGWTDSGGNWSAEAGAAHSGSYGFECADVESGTKTLTSDRFEVVAGTPAKVVLFTNEHQYEAGTENVLLEDDAFIYDSSPTTNKGSESFILVGELNTDSIVSRGLIRNDLSAYDPILTINSAVLNLHLVGEASSNTRTLRAYRLLQAWTEAGVTWNKYDGTDDWDTAGAGDTTNDREATDIGSLSLSASEAIGWKQLTLTVAKVKEWIDSTLNNNGVLLQMDTENGDAYYFASNNYPGATYRPYLALAYQKKSDYSISIKFYDNSVGGTLLGTTVLCTEANEAGWRQVSAAVTAPEGATHAEFLLSAGVGYGFRVDDIYFQYTTSLYFQDEGLFTDGNPVFAKAAFALADQFQWRSANGGTVYLTRTPTASQLYGGYTAQTYALDGDYLEGRVTLAPGTYDISILGATLATAGKVDIYIDGVKVTSTALDLYSAATAYNTYATQAGVVVARGGSHHVKMVVNGKNASSSSYKVPITGVRFMDVNPSGSETKIAVLTPTADTDIQQDNATTNYATSANIHIGEWASASNADRHALIKHAITSIPAGATIETGSYLRLWLNGDYASAVSTVQIFRCTRDWVVNQATWNIYSTGNNWATAGGMGAGDYNSTVLGSLELTASESPNKFIDIPLNADGVAVIQGWLDGDLDNYGFILATADKLNDLYRYNSSEGTYLPELVVKYTT